MTPLRQHMITALQRNSKSECTSNSNFDFTVGPRLLMEADFA
jgi:hypothetical protein